MELNAEDTNTAPAGDAAEPAEKPVRRRASRRVTAAAGTVAAPAADAPAPAGEAPAAEKPEAAGAGAGAPESEQAAPEAETAPKKRATRSRKKAVEAPAEGADAPAAEATAAAASASASEEAPASDAEQSAPKKRATRSRKKAVETADAAEAPEASQASAGAESGAQASAEETPNEAPAKRGRGRRAQAETDAPRAEDRDAASSGSKQAEESGASNGETADAQAGSSDSGEGEKNGRNRRGRGRGQKNEASETSESEQNAGSSDEGKGRGQSQNGDKNGDRDRGASNKNADSSSRSSRTRQRDRKRRGQNDEVEPEITEDDVLLPIAGILDVLDNYAFVRTSGYLPGTSDVYVSLGQVKKYGLRRGDAVAGAIRQPRDGEGGSRQKYNAIVRIDTVNARPVEEDEKRVDIAELTPVYPQERLRFETAPERLVGRAIDLVAPIGLGQRALIEVPATVASNRVVGELAEAVSANRPDAHLMLVLANAQPEEATRLQRTIRGEVVAATFDRSAEDQTTIAELAVDRARRLVELGHDVVVIVDSLNHLARAYAQSQQGPARPAVDTVDDYALGQLKKLLAAARNVENGGSLTVLATVLTKTGVETDKLILREARAVVNCEVRFAKRSSGLDPVVDLAASHTRNADDMLGEDEARVLAQLRASLSDEDASEKAAELLRSTGSNAALLAEVQRSGGLS